jgi:hypothetical protein
MAYRGMDLDLRTPVLRPRLAREAGSDMDPLDGLEGRRARVQAYSGTRPADPIWVDETVLACCNHAYDVALAHGSAEVRLEHLVLALTKVEAAARALEERGIREGQLRRECAALIASEMPTAPIADRGPPRRSDEFADVLRRAAQRAAQRGAAAGVDDVLAVLLAHPDDLPAILILRAHAPEWSRLSHVSLASTAPAPRLEPVMPDTLALRLEAMEGAMRAMQAEFAADRRVLADLVRDIQRDLGGQRNELANRLQDIDRSVAGRLKAIERLQALEGAVDARLSDLARLWTVTSERMQALERAIEARSPEGTSIATISDRLGMLGQNWATVESRLQAIERTWKAREAQAHAAPRTAMERLAEVEAMVHGGLTRVAERLASLETKYAQRPPSEIGSEVFDRMATLERTVLAGLQDGARNWAALGQRLQVFETAIASAKPQADESILAELSEKMHGIERGLEAPHRELAAGVQHLTERLTALERALASRPADKVGWDHVGERLTGIEALLTDPHAAAASGTVEPRLRAMEEAIAAQRADAADHRLAILGQLDTVAAKASEAAKAPISLVPVVERLDSLKATAETRHKEAAQTLNVVNARTVEVEAALRHNAGVASEASLSLQRDLADVAMVVSRLAGNQEALQSAVTDWRYELQAERGAIAATLRDIVARMSTLRVAANGHASAEGLTVAAVPAPAPTIAKPAVSAPVPITTNGRAWRFHVGVPAYWSDRSTAWRWLFGTDSVREANANAEQRWRDVHRTWRDRARPET